MHAVFSGVQTMVIVAARKFNMCTTDDTCVCTCGFSRASCYPQLMQWTENTASCPQWVRMASLFRPCWLSPMTTGEWPASVRSVLRWFLMLVSSNNNRWTPCFGSVSLKAVFNVMQSCSVSSFYHFAKKYHQGFSLSKLLCRSGCIKCWQCGWRWQLIIYVCIC